MDARLSTNNISSVKTHLKHGLNENETSTANVLKKDVGTIHPKHVYGKNVSNSANSSEDTEDKDIAARDEVEDIIVEGILEIAANDDDVEGMVKHAKVTLSSKRFLIVGQISQTLVRRRAYRMTSDQNLLFIS